jgi:hypothetical protein
VVDQVGDHFGVGLALEHVAERGQFGAQFVVVFDDAVVDQRDARLFRRRREVRVGVVRGRRAVRGPAGVGDAGEALQVRFVDLLFQSATREVLRERCSWPSTCRATPQES